MKSITRIHVLSSILFLILSFLLSANSTFAETKTFIKEYNTKRVMKIAKTPAAR